MKEKFVFTKELIKIELPPRRTSKADFSSVGLSSKPIQEFRSVVGSYGGVVELCH